MSEKVYKSARGFVLATQSMRDDARPLLTVEVYMKWYELFVIYADDRIERVGFDELEVPWARRSARVYRGVESAFVDHVPNPAAVELLAEERGWHLDECAIELITGRWMREVVDR